MSTTNTQASSYNNKSKPQQELGLMLMDTLEIKKGATVLDLGCGTGYLAKVLSERVGAEGKVVAVDPDGDRLKIAREKYSDSNIDYIQADDKTFPQGPYDLIFSNTVIHWIKDKRALLKRVHDNLSPGGCFAFSTSNGVLPLPEIGKGLFDKLVGPDFIEWMVNEKMVFWNASEYKHVATKVGFTQMSNTLIPYYPKWNNLDDYIDSMYGWFQGEFDPTQFDQEALEEIKQEYGSGPIIQHEPIENLHAILTKPLI